MHEAITAGGIGRRPASALDRLAGWLVVAVLLLWPLVLVAFWPLYLSRVGEADAYRHAHAMAGTAWLLLLVVQPLLVRARRYAAHRLVGRAGVVVGVA